MFRDTSLLELKSEGFIRLKNAIPLEMLEELNLAVNDIKTQFPNGFINPGFYSKKKPKIRMVAPDQGSSLPTLIYPNIGFYNTDILAPLAETQIHDFLESIVGKDFYLSNTWMQIVPPGAQRLNFHKDPRGSVTLTILLDDVDNDMGSTCVVPKSHVNTPPARYCFTDVMRPHPHEIELNGTAGDIIIFSPETWHARSANQSKHSHKRLFFNFYSRSTKDTTAWHTVVTDEQVEAAKQVIPEAYHHYFTINPNSTEMLQTKGISRFRKWVFKRSSSDEIIRDFVYSMVTVGSNVQNAAEASYLRPHSTTLMEDAVFKPLEYLSYLKLKAVVREMIVNPLRRLKKNVFI